MTGLLPGSPASRAGLVVGDTLVKVNDTELTGVSISKLSAMFVGTIGPKVQLLVRHRGNGKAERIELTRERFVIDPVTLEQARLLHLYVTERLAQKPRDIGLLELHAELVGISSDWKAQVTAYTAAIRVLAEQPAEAVSGILRRLYRRRGDTHVNLEKWQEAVDDYAHIVTPETTDARLLANRAHAHEALQLRDAAVADYRRSLEADPDSSLVAAELARLLLDKPVTENPVPWTVLKPMRMKADGGARLTLQEDGSVFVNGKSPTKDVYTLDFEDVPEDVRAVRLEAMRDDRLPGGGPGTNPGGNFVLSEFKVLGRDRSKSPGFKQIRFGAACATFEERPARDSLEPGESGWSIYHHQEFCRTQTAYFSVARVGANPVSSHLRILLVFSHVPVDGNPATLGRFRLSVSTDADSFRRERRRLAGTKMTDPWFKLAAAYDAIGDRKALDNLVKNHPEAAVGIGDLYAADEDWERAIAELRKFLSHGPADISLLTRLAADYESSGRTREAVFILDKMHADEPRNTAPLLKLASLQAWFRQETEYAETRERALASVGKVTNAVAADKTAKACLLLPSTDKVQLEEGLALARKALELGKSNAMFPWFQVGLGIAEYRNGRFAEADAMLLLAAETGEITNTSVGFTAAFYRAMSLFRQGKEKEARQIAIEAAIKMKPLPMDEENPLVGGNDADDLILWLAYKEAKAMIGFDAAPGDSPTPAKK